MKKELARKVIAYLNKGANKSAKQRKSLIGAPMLPKALKQTEEK